MTDFSSHDSLQIYTNLGGIAVIAKLRGQSERAIRLFGAATNKDWGNVFKTLRELTPFLTDITELHAQMEEPLFDKAWADGKAMTRKEVIAYALEEQAYSTKTHLSNSTNDTPLTEREIEIVQLLADGLNSREIAERLFLSVETIRWYIKIIYSKLDVHSRSEAIARAKELNLLM